MKSTKFQGLIPAAILMILTVLFVAVMVTLSVGSRGSSGGTSYKVNATKKLPTIAMLPSSLSLPASPNTVAVIGANGGEIDIEIDEMGLHIVDSSVLKVWQNKKTGKYEAENMGLIK